eukprot:Nk52_evm36s2449 gene=Nk52_evmTU36s2449
MKFDYKFSNLCGTVYKQGNVLFSTAEGSNTLLSPVGNRVSLYDLSANKSTTLPCENRKDVHRIAQSPNGALLITIDADGRAILINTQRRCVLNHFNFKANNIRDCKFSPDGRFIAVTIGKHVQVWRAPGFTVEFAPFVLHRTYTGHYDAVTCVDWSSDSRFFVTGSRDLSCRVYSLDPMEDYRPVTLTGHRDVVIGVFFDKEDGRIYTVARDGALFVWEKVLNEREEEAREMSEEMKLKRELQRGNGSRRVVNNCMTFKLRGKHYFNQNHAKVTCATFHRPSGLLITGFDCGIFTLHEVPDFTHIHSLSISQKKISTVAVNPSGEWIAFGCDKLGQLLVWEWQSETYVLKQQGHFYDMNVLSYSPTGQYVATGGDDGKVKVWNTTNGFCFVTFKEHTGGITNVQFSKNGHSVFSASLDGTIRGFDMIRYRNFRTMTSPNPVQFTSLALDPSGQIVCAGTLDTFEIYVWSIQTGRLLDVLTGHEGPVCGLAFSPDSAVLASCSWDKTVKIWDIFDKKAAVESFGHKTDCLGLAFRPDGKEIVVATLDGQLNFWNVSDATQVMTIEGRKDLTGGRLMDDKVTAKNNGSGKCFSSVCYSADGKCVLAGGRSKFVCIYELSQNMLLKKFTLSNNRSVDGIVDKLNSKNMTEAGALDTIDDEDASDLEDRIDNSLPGVSSGDLSKRKTRPEIRTKDIQFSPTGRSWAATSTEGLVIYSLDDYMVFDPFNLDIDITPDTTIDTANNGDYVKALCMALRLNEQDLTKKVFEMTPVSDIDFVSQQIPVLYVEKLLKFIGGALEDTVHIEFYINWCISLINIHGKYLKENANNLSTSLRAIQKNCFRHFEGLAKMCDDNRFMMEYVTQLCDTSVAYEEKKYEAEGFGDVENAISNAA